MARLVVFAPNWLGDAVMALPAIADVRRAFPDASLTIAARSAITPLFAMVPGIDATLALDTGTAPMRFEIALLLPNSFHAALRAWRAGVPERWGYRTDWRGPLLTRAVEQPSGHANAAASSGTPAGHPDEAASLGTRVPVHQVKYYQHLVGALGCPNGSGTPRVVLSDELRLTATQELRSAGWDGRRPLVALAPGAAYGGAKRWPPASFAGLARALADDGVQPVMVGGRADLPMAREIEASLGGDVVLNLMGTDLPTLAAILASCRALVSNDSGAMHLGAALGVRVTAVFGPTDERVTSPVGDAHVVLTNPVWCRPCGMRECPIDHRCMRGVGVDRVVGAVRQML